MMGVVVVESCNLVVDALVSVQIVLLLRRLADDVVDSRPSCSSDDDDNSDEILCDVVIDLLR